MTRKATTKKTTKAKAKVSKAAPPKKNHPSYEIMVMTAISNLKERGGSSMIAIGKEIKATFADLPEEAMFKRQLKIAIKRAQEKELIERAAASYKLTAEGKTAFAKVDSPKKKTTRSRSVPKKKATTSKSRTKRASSTSRAKPKAKPGPKRKKAAPKKVAPKKKVPEKPLYISNGKYATRTFTAQQGPRTRSR